MNPANSSKIKTDSVLLALIIIVYVLLGIATINNCYFWDVIQQVSREGFWFYKTNFSSLLIPADNEYNIFSTGYHPPLMGLMTALLWKVFGYSLWVSHAFALFWAALLIFHTRKLFSGLFPSDYAGWAMLIVLLEPAVLGQFVIASPDFILFTAFIISVRAILEKKPIMLAIGIFFVCCINIRGLFVGMGLFVANLYYNLSINKQNPSLKVISRTFLPYLPTLLILLAYYIYYLANKGWFFTNSEYSEHYILPDSLFAVIKHLLAFVLRSVEDGRIVIWILFLFLLFSVIRKKTALSAEGKMLLLFVLLVNGLYFLFVFISQMPFSPRYFLPQFFSLSVLVLLFLAKNISTKRLKITITMVVLLFTITGHLWIYPERISKPWDSSLAHLPYYELRKDCFDYIDDHDFDYDDMAAGFNLYGNRGYIELENYGKVVVQDSLNKRYFIYSNISNLEDEMLDELFDGKKWSVVQRFTQWPVHIVIYEKTDLVSRD